MTLGAFNNATSRGNEVIDVYFDDVVMTRVGGSEGGVLSNDTVEAGATAVLVSGPAHGSLIFPEDGVFLYTPEENFFGEDTFTYHAVDGTGTSSPATVTINVTPQNDPPVAVDNSYDAQEDIELVVTRAGGVLLNDSDVERDVLIAVLEETVSHGSLTLDRSGRINYMSDPNFFGTDSFTYRASDGTDQSEPATVTITVANTPDPPDAQADFYTAEENQPLAITAASGQSGPVSEIIVDYGAVWRYDDTGTDLRAAWRQPGYDDRRWGSGPAELGYGDDDEATVVASGPADNRQPTTYFRRTFNVPGVASIVGATISIRRDDGCVVYLNGTQVGIDHIEDNPGYATFAENAGDDGNSVIEFTGIDLALFVEGDNLLAVEIHQADASSSDISFDLRLEIERLGLVGVLANDSDLDGLSLTAVLESGPSHGTVDLSPDGTFVYRPGLNYEGTDSFTYLADNGVIASEGTATMTVIGGPNNIPESPPDNYAPTEDVLYFRAAVIGVLSNDEDPDGDALTALLKTPPSHGFLLLFPDGRFTYIPSSNFFGTDTFTYAAFDGVAESPEQLVTLEVANTPDPPVAQADTYYTSPGQRIFVPVGGGVLSNDFDPDQTPLTAQLVTQVTSGTLSFFGPGFFLYTPANNNPGSVTFTYVASDGALISEQTTVTIHLDTAPAASVDEYEVTEDAVLAVADSNGLLENDDDVEDDPLEAVLVTPPVHGSVTVNPNGSFRYAPETNYNGADSFTYLARGGVRSSPPALVSLTITPVNDPPTALADSYLATTEQVLVVGATAGVLANDFDVDNASLAASLFSPPGNGTLGLNPDGSFSYEPSPGFTGRDTFSYRASDGSLNSLPVTAEIVVGGASDSVVINEIMYHPPSGDDADEYIELANISDGALNLRGWSFSAGLGFTFPDVSVPPGGYLVVASDPAQFIVTYGPVENLVGGWTGSLSNRGERIGLVDLRGDPVDELEYSDQGDWATRTRVLDTGEPGWVWESPHDGGGSSLELVQALLTNKAGQNWLPSAGGPTPGASNSVAAPADAVAPLILDVGHAPRVPRSTDTVTIRAALRSAGTGSLSAAVHYRISSPNPPGFSTTAMADDGLHDDGEPGDGLFGAALPSMPVGTIVEFFIAATDGTNARTWPAPTTEGQVANALYQVDDEVHTGREGIYRLILSVPENAAFNGIDRDSNAQMNCTLVADDCSGPVVRYLCGMRVRGASSRADNPPPMRVNIPRDRPWNGTTSMNLNSQFTWLQFIGMTLFQASDLAAPDSKRVAVRRNGQDFATGDQEDYGSWVHVEPLDENLVDDKFPEDRQGNLYKKVRPDVDWAYRNGNFGRYPQDGWGKETNASENDWVDLDEFLRVMNQAPGAPDYIAQVEAVADLDQWMRWFAVQALITNGETNAGNGADDDYSIYRGVADPRFQFLPHDLDTILGHGDASRITNPQRTIFDMMQTGDVLDPLVPLFTNPTIRTRYFQAFRDLIRTSFAKDRFDALLNNHLAGWVPQNVIDDVIVFMDARRAHIAAIVEANLGPPPATVDPVTVDSLAGPHGSLYLSEVLAVNESAHSSGGYFSDYIELHNAGSALGLAGYSISDDPALPRKYVFSTGSVIASGQRLLLYADSILGAPGIQLGFGLSRDGEGVYLYDPAGTLVDSVVFGLQVPDRSIGRTGAATDAWSLNRPTPGAVNVAQSLGSPSTLRINEWLSKPDLVFNEDFIELYNPDPRPVSLGGLAITDDPRNYPQRAVLPALSFIEAGGFAVMEAVGSNNARPGNSAELPFKLGADHGWIAIYGSNAVEIDRVHTLCESRDQSRGRVTDGAASYADFVLPTPGISNSTDTSAASAVLQSLRVTEIMYHPANGGSDAEFIELRNVGGAPIDLEGVSFTMGISFGFPAMTLGPGESVVVVANRAVFESIYGQGVNIAGVYSGKLDNDQDRVRLEVRSLNAAILDFTYLDAWYPETDGGGFSLLIVDETAAPSAWGRKENWTAGGVENGTPGADDGFFVFAGADQVVSLPAAATLNATVHYGSLDPQSVTLAWSLENGPAVAVFGSGANEDTTVSVATAGRYTFELIATPQVGPVMRGQVTVTFRDTFANWATTHFGSPLALAADKLADGDRDGYVNLIEFVLGLDPNLPDPAGLLKPTVEEGVLALTYFRPYFDHGAIRVIPEVSSDLLLWQDGPGIVSETVLASMADGEFVRAVDLSPLSNFVSRFLRLRVVCAE